MKLNHLKMLLVVLMSMFVTKAFAQEVIKVKNADGVNIYYRFIKSYTEMEVARNLKYKGFIVIPASVEYKGKTYKVTAIGNDAFWRCENLTSVTIPDGVTAIGDHAFSGCKNLISVTIPDGVRTIGYSAFNGCIALDAVTIPGSVTSIGAAAFSNCRFSSFVIPESVKKIGDEAFKGSSITSIIIPGSVASIGKAVFLECQALTSVTILEGVKAIAERTFEGCISLTSVTIPNGVTSIGRFAFYNCTELNSITIPASIESIESYAFSGCMNLHSLAIPKNCSINTNNVSYGTDVQITRYDPNDYPLLADNQPTVESQPQQPVVQPQPARPQPTANVKADVDLNIPVSSSPSKNTFAVVIGNEDYQKVSKVEYAQNDAETFAAYCQKTLGLPEKNIRSYKNATYATMLSAVKDIQDIAKAYKGELNVLFYYAGHGIPNESTGDAFLLPIDADGRQTEVCYPLNRLYSELGGMEARSVTVFMDACFSGSERGNQMLASARGVAIKAKASAPSGNMVVFSAASGDETAYPYKEKGHGLFTYFLLKKLQETKGDVSLSELGNYIVDNVSKESVVSNGKSQTPTVTASLSVADTWQNMKLR